MKKITFYIFVILFLSTAGYFLVNNTANNNDDWLIYENTEYDYKVSYPKDAIIANTGEMNPYSINKSNNIMIFIPDKKTRVLIFVSLSDGESANDSYMYINNNMEEKIFNLNNRQIKIHYVSDDEISKEIVESFQFLNNLETNQSDWRVYKNIKYGYEIKYPSNNLGPYVESSANKKTVSVDQSEVIEILTSRGKLGIVSLRIPFEIGKNPLGSFIGEVKQKQEEFVSLPLNDFVEQIWKSNIDQIGKDTKFGLDRRVIGKIREEKISDKITYSFEMSNASLIKIPYANLHIPLNSDSYTYTFIENHNDDKFIIWFPSDEPVFREMKNSFNFK